MAELFPAKPDHWPPKTADSKITSLIAALPYQKGGMLWTERPTFENNNATDRGVAIYGAGGDMQVVSLKFVQNPGIHAIRINGTRPMQAKVLIRDCNVSNNPGVFG